MKKKVIKKMNIYPICPDCGQNTVVLFTPPKEPPDYTKLGTNEYVDWDKASLYCCNDENCKFSPKLTELTTPQTEKRMRYIRVKQEGEFKWLRNKRMRCGLSLREMARKLGISAMYLCDIELGRRRCPDWIRIRYGKVRPKK